jgi:hypothetical protein
VTEKIKEENQRRERTLKVVLIVWLPKNWAMNAYRWGGRFSSGDMFSELLLQQAYGAVNNTALTLGKP